MSLQPHMYVWGIFLPEESVWEYDIIHILARRVVKHVFVDEKRQRHVHFFSCKQCLLFETETLYFGEAGSNLSSKALSFVT